MAVKDYKNLNATHNVAFFFSFIHRDIKTLLKKFTRHFFTQQLVLHF